ncbi:hypothetical protein [Chamaesiphon sp. VAR_48_metabat_403]|uniref:hypothetical protein n=1 Tax=Chamaesiphon sp. VAR_48_metabat_403 TaxID=2964700 RepID=UPI00286EAA63|nr:hypothetical protein [Chamaesiphon sp. VAR_48_metabat_403]
MNEDIYSLHLNAGKAIGKDKTCGSKIDYQTELTASEAAERMNSKPNTRNILEAYPCAFCQGWHIGRAMTKEELESYIE